MGGGWGVGLGYYLVYVFTLGPVWLLSCLIAPKICALLYPLPPFFRFMLKIHVKLVFSIWHFNLRDIVILMFINIFAIQLLFVAQYAYFTLFIFILGSSRCFSENAAVGISEVFKFLHRRAKEEI